MKFILMYIISAVVLCNTASAATGDPIELQIRYGYYHAVFSINENGTAVESHEWSKKILKETALEHSKRASISYSTSAQKADITAAYTLKADGRRIDVPKDNYQLEINSGKGKDSPVYSDSTQLTVVFPDVAVGDSVVLSYKLIQTEPMFPGHYSASQVFYKYVAHDDVRVKFDYPASMWVQYEARDMKEAVSRTSGDRKIVEWHYANPIPIKSDRRNYSVYDVDKEAGYAFSTFRTYEEIAKAYGIRAEPKAVISERIRKLADEIVKGTTGSKEQAKVLYEWVARNFTYAGNCIGIGAVVPRDMPFVLDNKMGDCKDHATLLQALLSAKGIKSIQALVNASSMYRLPKIPVVSAVNHVINYLPELSLFVDSTSDATPFGMLPFGDQDKPALLVDNFMDGMKTPVPKIGSNRQQVKSLMKILPNGSISGSVEVFHNGQSAVNSRAWARKVTKDMEDDMVKNILKGQGMIGSGKFEKEDPDGLTDSYRFKASYNAEKFIKIPGSGAFYIHPPLGMASSILASLHDAMEIEKEADVACWNDSVSEDYTIELPKNIKVLSVPADLKVSNDYLSYKSKYKLKGNVLAVQREFVDRTKGNVCTPQLLAEYKKVVEKVIDNLKEQVLYK
jgi:transglutaminase-like putative cysteine protease